MTLDIGSDSDATEKPKPKPQTLTSDAEEFSIIIDSRGRRWDPRKHPRDRKGRFIETFAEVRGFLKSYNTKPSFAGRVLALDPDGKAVVELRAGKGKFAALRGRLIKVPFSSLETYTPKARLDAKARRPLSQETRSRIDGNPDTPEQLPDDADAQYDALYRIAEHADKQGNQELRDQALDARHEINNDALTPEQEAQIKALLPDAEESDNIVTDTTTEEEPSERPPAPAPTGEPGADQASTRERENRVAGQNAAAARAGNAWARRDGGGSGVSRGDGLPVAARWSPTDEVVERLESINASPVEFDELAPGPEAGKAFHEAITAAKASNKYGASVHVYDEADYAAETGIKLFLSPDSKVGFAVKEDGDIVSVFSADKTHAKTPQSIIPLAIQSGGTKADAFDTVLPALYTPFGLTPTGRSPWNDEFAPDDWDYETFSAFNDGRPAVIFFQLDPSTFGASYDREATAKANLPDPYAETPEPEPEQPATPRGVANFRTPRKALQDWQRQRALRDQMVYPDGSTPRRGDQVNFTLTPVEQKAWDRTPWDDKQEGFDDTGRRISRTHPKDKTGTVLGVTDSTLYVVTDDGKTHELSRSEVKTSLTPSPRRATRRGDTRDAALAPYQTSHPEFYAKASIADREQHDKNAAEAESLAAEKYGWTPADDPKITTLREQLAALPAPNAPAFPEDGATPEQVREWENALRAEIDTQEKRAALQRELLAATQQNTADYGGHVKELLAELEALDASTTNKSRRAAEDFVNALRTGDANDNNTALAARGVASMVEAAADRLDRNALLQEIENYSPLYVRTDIPDNVRPGVAASLDSDRAQAARAILLLPPQEDDWLGVNKEIWAEYQDMLDHPTASPYDYPHLATIMPQPGIVLPPPQDIDPFWEHESRMSRQSKALVFDNDGNLVWVDRETGEVTPAVPEDEPTSGRIPGIPPSSLPSSEEQNILNEDNAQRRQDNTRRRRQKVPITQGTMWRILGFGLSSDIKDLVLSLISVVRGGDTVRTNRDRFDEWYFENFAEPVPRVSSPKLIRPQPELPGGNLTTRVKARLGGMSVRAMKRLGWERIQRDSGARDGLANAVLSPPSPRTGVEPEDEYVNIPAWWTPISAEAWRDRDWRTYFQEISRYSGGMLTQETDALIDFLMGRTYRPPRRVYRFNGMEIVDWDGATDEQIARIAAQAEKLQRDYPHPSGRMLINLSSYGTHFNDADANAASGQSFVNRPILHLNLDKLSKSPGEIAADHAAGLLQIDRGDTTWSFPEFYTEELDPLTSVFTHEWGHTYPVADDRFYLNDMQIDFAKIREASFQLARDLDNGYTDAELTRMVGQYGNSEPVEFFAEMFAASYQAQNPSPIARAFKAVLDSLEPGQGQLMPRKSPHSLLADLTRDDLERRIPAERADAYYRFAERSQGRNPEAAQVFTQLAELVSKDWFVSGVENPKLSEYDTVDPRNFEQRRDLMNQIQQLLMSDTLDRNIQQALRNSAQELFGDTGVRRLADMELLNAELRVAAQGLGRDGAPNSQNGRDLQLASALLAPHMSRFSLEGLVSEDNPDLLVYSDDYKLAVASLALHFANPQQIPDAVNAIKRVLNNYSDFDEFREKYGVQLAENGWPMDAYSGYLNALRDFEEAGRGKLPNDIQRILFNKIRFTISEPEFWASDDRLTVLRDTIGAYFHNNKFDIDEESFNELSEAFTLFRSVFTTYDATDEQRNVEFYTYDEFPRVQRKDFKPKSSPEPSRKQSSQIRKTPAPDISGPLTDEEIATPSFANPHGIIPRLGEKLRNLGEELLRGRSKKVKRGAGNLHLEERYAFDKHGVVLRKGDVIWFPRRDARGRQGAAQRPEADGYILNIVTKTTGRGKDRKPLLDAKGDPVIDYIRVRHYDPAYVGLPHRDKAQRDKGLLWDKPYWEFDISGEDAAKLVRLNQEDERAKAVIENFGIHGRRMAGRGAGRIAPIVGKLFRLGRMADAEPIQNRLLRDRTGRLIGEGDIVNYNGELYTVVRPNYRWDNNYSPRVALEPIGGGKVRQPVAANVEYVDDPKNMVFFRGAGGIAAPRPEDLRNVLSARGLATPELMAELAKPEPDSATLVKLLNESPAVKEFLFAESESRAAIRDRFAIDNSNAAPPPEHVPVGKAEWYLAQQDKADAVILHAALSGFFASADGTPKDVDWEKAPDVFKDYVGAEADVLLRESYLDFTSAIKGLDFTRWNAVDRMLLSNALSTLSERELNSIAGMGDVRAALDDLNGILIRNNDGSPEHAKALEARTALAERLKTWEREYRLRNEAVPVAPAPAPPRPPAAPPRAEGLPADLLDDPFDLYALEKENVNNPDRPTDRFDSLDDKYLRVLDKPDFPRFRGITTEILEPMQRGEALDPAVVQKWLEQIDAHRRGVNSEANDIFQRLHDVLEAYHAAHGSGAPAEKAGSRPEVPDTPTAPKSPSAAANDFWARAQERINLLEERGTGDREARRKARAVENEITTAMDLLEEMRGKEGADAQEYSAQLDEVAQRLRDLDENELADLLQREVYGVEAKIIEDAYLTGDQRSISEAADALNAAITADVRDEWRKTPEGRAKLRRANDVLAQVDELMDDLGSPDDVLGNETVLREVGSTLRDIDPEVFADAVDIIESVIRQATVAKNSETSTPAGGGNGVGGGIDNGELFGEDNAHADDANNPRMRAMRVLGDAMAKDIDAELKTGNFDTRYSSSMRNFLNDLSIGYTFSDGSKVIDFVGEEGVNGQIAIIETPSDEQFIIKLDEGYAGNDSPYGALSEETFSRLYEDLGLRVPAVQKVYKDEPLNGNVQKYGLFLMEYVPDRFSDLNDVDSAGSLPYSASDELDEYELRLAFQGLIANGIAGQSDRHDYNFMWGRDADDDIRLVYIDNGLMGFNASFSEAFSYDDEDSWLIFSPADFVKRGIYANRGGYSLGGNTNAYRDFAQRYIQEAQDKGEDPKSEMIEFAQRMRDRAARLKMRDEKMRQFIITRAQWVMDNADLVLKEITR